MDVHLKQTLVLLGNIKTQITEFVQNPPFGFPKKYLESIQNSFSLSEWICRVLNSYDKRIKELETRLDEMTCPGFKPVEVCGACDSESFDRDYRCTECRDNCLTTKCKHQLEAANDE